MVECAALLVDDLLPHLPMRQWMLSAPFQLWYLFASQPQVMGKELGIVYRAIETHLIHQAGLIQNAESLEADYKMLLDKPEFATIKDWGHFMATWDNHDYGLHNGGAEFELKEMARKVFLDFFGEPENSPRRKRDGIYDAKIMGPEGKRIQVIMLDNRWNRGPLIADTRSDEERAALGIVGSMGHAPNTDSTVTLLGESQWQWLEEQLKQPQKFA